uniref:TIL domain-containing protein n=1 Tax=Syphacia muris TaxID=451379 RepID=A0A0N5ANU9_9BILA
LRHNRHRFFSECANRFCPIGTFCDLHEAPCLKKPCKPMTVCLPESLNGCKAFKCSRGQKCVETRTSCISRSCKKIPKCVPQGGH